jgi:hypothetical protein
MFSCSTSIDCCCERCASRMSFSLSNRNALKSFVTCSRKMLSWARYYPRNTVIPYVIPKKLVCADSMLLFFGWYKYRTCHTQMKERIQRYIRSKGQASAPSGKGPKFGSKCHYRFLFFFVLLTLLSFPDQHFVSSCVSDTCSPCPKL